MASSRNNALEFSSAGSIVLTPPLSQSGKFGAIHFLKDSEINDLQGTNISDDDLSKLQERYGAGTILYGNFTEVSLASGLAQLHRV